jgi:uncharacterized membrane protein
MLIDPAMWPRMHGATTHFPVALTMVAVFCDGLGYLLPASSPHKVKLIGAGYYVIILGALGTFPAVLSGLFMTKGEVLGHDALLYHHLLVWPSFALLVGLGAWRAIVGERYSPRGFRVYLCVLLLAAGLMAGAGYWGGELILNA